MPALEATPAAAANATVIELTRTIRAPRSKVFHAWTTAELLMQWFGSIGMMCPDAAIDARVGGSYRIDFAPACTDQPAKAKPDGPPAHVSGTYTKVVLDSLLQFTWTPSFLPGEESLVTVSLEDATDGTLLKLRHERFVAESPTPNYTKGWTDTLTKLAANFEAN
jgi:uncharacterized protein YndB with AHSA1/START domain